VGGGLRMILTRRMKMGSMERVTVTLPNELQRRRWDELRQSLDNPHPETSELAEQGLDDWATGLPEEDTEALIVATGGEPIQWVPGEGWVAGRGCGGGTRSRVGA
jgi:hypothetical protein